MRIPWISRSLLTTAAALVCTAVNAQTPSEYRCLQGDIQRRVAIFYETGVAVPCEVHYFKDTEAPGEREVLWRALNESGYCEAQTRAFIEKLEGLGWVCTAAEPDDVVDDTQDLAPATEPAAGG